MCGLGTEFVATIFQTLMNVLEILVASMPSTETVSQTPYELLSWTENFF